MNTNSLRCGDMAIRVGQVVGCHNRARYKVTRELFGPSTSIEYVCGRHIGWFRRNGNYSIEEIA